MAELETSRDSRFVLQTKTLGHTRALRQTAAAYAFLHDKAGVHPPTLEYTQGFFLPGSGVGQEVVGLSLLSETYLRELEEHDSVALMAHD